MFLIYASEEVESQSSKAATASVYLGGVGRQKAAKKLQLPYTSEEVEGKKQLGILHPGETCNAKSGLPESAKLLNYYLSIW